MSGIVFYDDNMNGEFDSGEPVIEGVQVKLYGAAGLAVERDTYTDSSGIYIFSGLLNGNYVVDIIPPAGHRFTGQSISCPSPLNFPVGRHRYNHGEHIITNLKSSSFDYIAIGDSIGFCVSLCNLLGLSPDCYQDELESRLQVINPDVSLSNLSIPGNETNDLLTLFSTGNVWVVVGANPQLVTISIGGNDFLNNDGNDTDNGQAWIRARANIQEIISQLLSQLPNADIEINTVYDNDADGTYPGTNPFHARWVDVWNNSLRDMAFSQRRHVIVAEIYPDYRHCDADNTNCCGIPGLICRDSVPPWPDDNIHPVNDGYQVHSEKLFESVGGFRIPGTNGTTDYTDGDFGYVQLIKTCYPSTTTYTSGTGATNLDKIYGLDANFAKIPLGDQEIRVTGFDSTPAGTIHRVVACIRYKTSGTHTNDNYWFEASVDGAFTPPPASLTPFNLNTIIPIVGGAGNGGAVVNAYPEYSSWRDVSSLITKNYDSIINGAYLRPQIDWADLNDISIRFRSELSGSADSMNVEWDAAWLEIYGIPGSTSVTPTPPPVPVSPGIVLIAFFLITTVFLFLAGILSIQK